MKLHLGCWHRYIPGYIHVDLCDLDHIDYNSDIGDLRFINDGRVDYIYCSHALEYKDYIDAELVLKEWYRVMKVGATIRVAVPDFEQLIKVYQITNDINKIIGPLYGKMDLNTNKIYHKCVYDFEKLTTIFKKAGFKNIKRFSWEDTEHSKIDDHSQAYFPHMDKKNGILISLNLEAKK